MLVLSIVRSVLQHTETHLNLADSIYTHTTRLAIRVSLEELRSLVVVRITSAPALALQLSEVLVAVNIAVIEVIKIVNRTVVQLSVPLLVRHWVDNHTALALIVYLLSTTRR